MQEYKHNWVCEDTKDWTNGQRRALAEALILSGWTESGGAYPYGNSGVVVVGAGTYGYLHGYDTIHQAIGYFADKPIKVSLGQLIEIIQDEKAGDCLLPKPEPKSEKMILIDGKEWSESSIKAALRAYVG